MTLINEMRNTTSKLLTFIDKSPTASFAVNEIKQELESHKFRQLCESNKWVLKPGEPFYIIRNKSAILAGIMGKLPPNKSGYKIIGAHTDSPGLRIKHSGLFHKAGYQQLGIEIYGGPLLASWTDRDLSLAGNILIREKSGIKSLLWKNNKALLRIPQAAIHLNRDVNDKGLILNKQTQMNPILSVSENDTVSFKDIMSLIAKDLGIKSKQISGYDLEVYDIQKGNFSGLNDELIVTGRIDNLAMCRASIQALTDIEETPDSTVLIALFDSEEIGSSTLNGGASPMLQTILDRLSISQGLDREDQFIAMTKSFNISADGAHAVHPNYTDKYDSNHYCFINKGPAIKINANQRYASNAETISRFENLCKDQNIPVQKYYHRNDIPCGSTIGPITSTNTGIKTLDIGNPMLAMHSIRETAGSVDQFYMEKVLNSYLKFEF